MLLSPLRSQTYRRLFAAQVIALLGTGLATVALALLAYELAGGDAGVVLGTALAIKMVAYVSLSPLAGAVAARVPRRAMLVGLDMVRMVAALCLPFVDAVWQIYVLIFVLQAGSALFTPTFQATIPDVLTDEKAYTRALSLSRLAYDLENLLSPAVAALLLLVMSFHALFAGTAIGFLVSALLVLSTRLPEMRGREEGTFRERVTGGLRTFLATPRLRGVGVLNFAVAAAGAMVIVNTVVYVRAGLGGGESAVAVAMAAFGAGSMLVAFVLPRVLEGIGDRTVMLGGAGLLAAGLALGLLRPGFLALLPVWGLLGMGYAAVQTPVGRLLRRSAQPEARPGLFSAQFALSHACWLVTYPLAGWLARQAGMGAAFAVLAACVVVALVLAAWLWPAGDPDVVEHVHTELPADHPHLQDAKADGGGYRHAHSLVIDPLHRRWPSPGTGSRV